MPRKPRSTRTTADRTPASTVSPADRIEAPARILLAGRFGHGSLCDEAHLDVLIREFRGALPAVSLTVVSGDPEATRRAYGVRAVHERDWPALIGSAGRCDLIVLAGAWFHDAHGVDEDTLLTPLHWGLTYLAAFPALARWSDTPLMLCGVGVGPLRSELARQYTRLAFEQANAATVRSPEAGALLASIGVDVDRVRVTADGAFLAHPPPPGEVPGLLRRVGVPAHQSCLVAVASGEERGPRPDTWPREVASALDRFVTAHKAFLVFVPSRSDGPGPPGGNGHATDRVRTLMREAAATTVLDPGLPPGDALGILAACDLVIAGNVPAVIMGAVAQTPVVALAADPGVQAAMEQFGMGDHLPDLGTATGSTLADRLDAAWRGRARLRIRLASAVAERRPAAARNLSAALLLLQNRSRRPPPSSAESTVLLNAAVFRQIRRAAVLEGWAQPGEVETADGTIAVAAAGLAAATDRLLDEMLAAHDAERQCRILTTELEDTRRNERRLGTALEETAEQLRRRAPAPEAQELSTALDLAREQLVHRIGEADELRMALDAARGHLLERTREASELRMALDATRGQMEPPTHDAAVLSDMAAAAAGSLAAVTESLLDEMLSAHGTDDAGRTLAPARARAVKARRPNGRLARLVESRPWRAAEGFAGLRSRTMAAARRAAAMASRLARAVSLALVPVPARRAIGRLLPTGPALMNPYEYVFDRYKRARAVMFPGSLGGLRAPGRPGLVSVVLPAYNGADMLHGAIDSVLAQTWTEFELIIVNDGSTDDTARIADDYAARDPRVRVIHQDNRKLPAALSRGFHDARGEFLTWTSCDNRLKPGFLERMVACLRRHPDWDMAYANVDLIDEQGDFLRGGTWYDGYRQPPGSEHVHLPPTTSELNVWPNNYVGAAFLYRSRVPFVVGDYSPYRFVLEDYDYWMRVNALLTLRHADFTEPVYDYRFHGRSLTARWDEYGMHGHRERLMVFEEFRRDFALSPLVWVIDGAAPAGDIGRRVRRSGQIVDDGRTGLADLPRFWVPVVYVHVSPAPAEARPDRDDLPAGVLAVLVTTADSLPAAVDPRWDLCVRLGGAADLPRLAGARQGWLGAADLDTLVHAIDVRARAHHTAAMEAIIEAPDAPSLKASVVICTHRANAGVRRAVESALGQTLPPEQYEILVVNNRPDQPALRGLVERLRTEHADRPPGHLRLVACPIRGLSPARNAGIAEARGEYVCFLDDDAVAEPDWLARVCAAFDANPATGVIGGHIVLAVPEPRPRALRPGWEKYWSHFVTGCADYTEVRYWWEFPWGANWSARREALLKCGGFRLQYGRVGDNFWGGEEIITAGIIRRLGYRIAVLPRAAVRHDVDPARFTFEHVRRTLVAGHCVSYLSQRDLYIPMETSLKTTLRLLARTHLDRSLAPRHRLRDAIYRKYAQWRLLVLQLTDLGRRRRRPIVAGRPVPRR